MKRKKKEKELVIQGNNLKKGKKKNFCLSIFPSKVIMYKRQFNAADQTDRV